MILSIMLKLLREFFCLHRKFLLWNLISRNIKLKYRRSYLGLFWTVLAPATSALIYFFVFKHVMRVEVPNYLTFILSGIMAWGYYSSALMGGLESIVGNQGLLSKVPMPLNVFALNEATTLFINFLLSQPVLFLVVLFTDTPITWNLLYLPFFYFLLYIQAYSLALILAILFVYFRDLRHLLALVLQMLFYLTPVVYQANMVPEMAKSIVFLIPHFYIFEGIHNVTALGLPIGNKELLICSVWTIVIFICAMIYFNYKKNFLTEKI